MKEKRFKEGSKHRRPSPGDLAILPKTTDEEEASRGSHFVTTGITKTKSSSFKGKGEDSTIDLGVADTQAFDNQIMDAAAPQVDGIIAEVAPFPTEDPREQGLPKEQMVPGAYLGKPGEKLRPMAAFRPSKLLPSDTAQFQAGDSTLMQFDQERNGAKDPSSAHTGSPGLVEAKKVSSEQFVAANAKEITHQSAQESKEQYAKKWLALSLAAILCISVLVLVLVLFTSLAGYQGSSTASTIGATKSNKTDDTNATNLADYGGEGAVVELMLEDLPKHTLASPQDPFSPQSEAYNWLTQHANLTNLPQWRRRQLFALGVIYFSLGGAHWPLGLDKDWLDDSTPECDWFSDNHGYFSATGDSYVEKSNVDENCNQQGETTVIRLTDGADYGFSLVNPSIPPEISFLTALKEFRIENNGITNLSSSEMFPRQFYHLTNLEFLSFGMNSLSKPVPSDLGRLTNLTKLKLLQANAMGSIPSELGLLSNLRTLDLSENLLTGRVPNQLGRLAFMRKLVLNDNMLSGTIPEQLCRLQKTSTCPVISKNNSTKLCSLGFDCSVQLCGCDCACNPRNT